MNPGSDQLGLFDAEQESDPAQVAAARARMRQMIDRLSAAAVPPWKDQMGVILDDGAFQRAMRLVPPDEARSLWAEFDTHMERLYAMFSRTDPARED
ncbi:MAG TPA: hypothetical protein VJY39_20950 [Acidisphaera sp.]|nr:hypothetical protein [Acidisphaera sp.]